jgi:hypothetical protein
MSAEVTPEMIDAYLKANDAYWREVDAMPPDITKPWRQGTPKEATRISLEAALAARPAPPCTHFWRVTKNGVTYCDSRCDLCGETKRSTWD